MQGREPLASRSLLGRREQTHVRTEFFQHIKKLYAQRAASFF